MRILAEHSLYDRMQFPIIQKKQRTHHFVLCFLSSVVQKKGVEPSRYCYHTDLNRARLPIPPLLQTVAPARCPPNQRMILYRVSVKKSTVFFLTLTVFDHFPVFLLPFMHCTNGNRFSFTSIYPFLCVSHRVFPLSGSILSIGNRPVCKPTERNCTPDHRNAKDRRQCKGNNHADT